MNINTGFAEVSPLSPIFQEQVNLEEIDVMLPSCTVFIERLFATSND